MKKLDLVNKTFGRLKVIKFSHTVKTKNNTRNYYFCICSCGKECFKCGSYMKTGHTQSCGCQVKENFNHFIHGHSPYRNESTFYKIWGRMVRRCHSKNSKDYLRYGKRGIHVCKEWRNFTNFLKDMHASFLEHQKIIKGKEISTIDRIDNSKGYFRENCRWATIAEQSRNRTSNINVVYKGQKMCLKDFAKAINIHYGKVYKLHRSGKLLSLFQ